MSFCICFILVYSVQTDCSSCHFTQTLSDSFTTKKSFPNHQKLFSSSENSFCGFSVHKCFQRCLNKRIITRQENNETKHNPTLGIYFTKSQINFLLRANGSDIMAAKGVARSQSRPGLSTGKGTKDIYGLIAL